MSREKYLRLGELLIKENLIDAQQLEKAIKIQKEQGGRLGEILVKLGLITEAELVEKLAKQLNIPYLSLDTRMLKP
ncbi:MAG: type II secretion system protein GspE, partial [Candidatus Omnitrophica bacterium]|nr:type II secretion system protein GspE [Candidatus Omnitrophota bacterium]